MPEVKTRVEFRPVHTDSGSKYDIYDARVKSGKTGTMTFNAPTTLEVKCNDETVASVDRNTDGSISTVKLFDKGSTNKIRLLTILGTPSETSWLSQDEVNPDILYDSAFPHPEFPHITGDLQQVER